MARRKQTVQEIEAETAAEVEAARAEGARDAFRDEWPKYFAALTTMRSLEFPDLVDAFKLEVAKELTRRGIKAKTDHVAQLHKLDRARYDELRAPFVKQADERYAVARAAMKIANDGLVLIAKIAAVHVGPNEHVFRISEVGTYGSQGPGHDAFYAEQSARVAAEELVRWIGDAHVTVRPVHWDDKRLRGWEIVALLEDEIDMEILKRKPAMALRDWVKSCWSKGINPRVLNPWLPHGYEEKNGIDYYGRDVAPTNTHRVTGPLP